MTETKILLVDALSLPQAAQVHAQAWRQSHRDFCSPEFVEMHTAERQKEYLRQKQREGCRLYLLWAPSPAGVVAVSPKGVIQDLYVLPQMQNRWVSIQDRTGCPQWRPCQIAQIPGRKSAGGV